MRLVCSGRSLRVTNRPIRAQFSPILSWSKELSPLCGVACPVGKPQKPSGITDGRLARFLKANKLAKFRKGHWRITDRRQREIAVISDGEERQIKVRGFGPASLAMRHREAVRQFLERNDAGLLVPFKGHAVTDTSMQKYLLETRPNLLYRLANAGSDADMKIYRLI